MSSSLSNLIRLILYAIVFITPFIFLPWTSELFEFNKMIFVYLMSLLLACTWGLDTFKNKRFHFVMTPLHIVFLLFLISQLISTFLSIDPHTSLWGYYSRFHGGLYSTLTYMFLYCATVSYIIYPPESDQNLTSAINRLQPFVYVALTSSIIVCFYGIAQHGGIDAHIWKQDVQRRVFSTLGQPNWLAAYILVLMPIVWHLIYTAFSGTQVAPARLILSLCLHLILYLTLLYTRSRSGFASFTVVYVLFWGLLLIRNLLTKTGVKSALIGTFVSTLVIVIISTLSATPFTQSLLDNQQTLAEVEAPPDPTLLISDSGEIRRIVWEGAYKLGSAYPVTGTGVETFAYSYYWTRTREHNDVSEWDFLYNKAHNEYLNYFANSGLLGLGTYVLCLATIVLLFLKNLHRQMIPTLTIALFCGWISIHLTNFFGFSVVLIGLYTFLLPALFIAPFTQTQIINLPIRKIPFLVGLGILIAVFYFPVSTIGRIFIADLNFAFAKKADAQNNIGNAFQLIQNAIALNPTEFTYHNYAIGISADIANQLQLNNDATAAAEFANAAITSANATILLNPYHINSWKDRASGFITLTTVDPIYVDHAINSLEFARHMAPTDPKITYNLALLYARKPNFQKSIDLLKVTLQLKPNYYDAQFALASYLHQTSMQNSTVTNPEQHQKAIKLLEEYLRTTGGSPYKNKLIDTWRIEATQSSEAN